MYSKGHPYTGYPGYIMMSNMNDSSYMNNGSLSPPMPRTVSNSLLFFFFVQVYQLNSYDIATGNAVGVTMNLSLRA